MIGHVGHNFSIDSEADKWQWSTWLVIFILEMEMHTCMDAARKNALAMAWFVPNLLGSIDLCQGMLRIVFVLTLISDENEYSIGLFDIVLTRT